MAQKFVICFLVFFITASAHAEQYEDELARMAQAVSTSIQQEPSQAIAVLDFTDLQGKTSELGRFLAEELSATLVISGNGIDVIDRANLSRILDEHKLQMSGLVDPENIKRLGQIAGVSALVIGTYTPLGENLRVQAKVVSTETAKIVGAAKGNINLTEAISGLMNTEIFVAQGTKDTAEKNTQPADDVQRLTQATEEYSVTLISSQFNPKSDMVNVQIEYRNLDQHKDCVALSSKEPFVALSHDGGLWDFTEVKGMKLFEPARGNRQASDFTVVPSGAIQRFFLLLKPGDINSKSKFDLSINFVRGDTAFNVGKRVVYTLGDGCSGYSDDVIPLTVSFSNIGVTN